METNTKRKGGRPKLTAEQRLASDEKRKQKFKEYNKAYYSENKEKFTTGLDYSKSCIYKMVSPDTDKVFIGGTTLPLNIRLNKHRYFMTTGRNKVYDEMMKLSQTWTIEALMPCNLNNKEELDTLETIWITAFADTALNLRKKYDDDAVKPLLPKFRLEHLPERYRPKN